MLGRASFIGRDGRDSGGSIRRPVLRGWIAGAGIAILGLGGVGCASDPTAAVRPAAGNELIELTTEPSGVNVEIPGLGTVRTPANVYLDPQDSHELRFYLHGYEDRLVTVEPSLGEWTAHATGRRHALEPAFIHLDMASGERLLTGGELSAWATAEAAEAHANAQRIQAEVSELVEQERGSFSRTERALAQADREIARAEAIAARDASRVAVEDAGEARVRAEALLREQMGLEAIALDHLDAARALVEAAHNEKLAMMELARITAEINAEATAQERMIAIMRGVLPPETLEEALVNALPAYRETMAAIRDGSAFELQTELTNVSPDIDGEAFD